MGERTGDVWRGRGGFGAPDDEEAEPGPGRRRGLGRRLTGLFVLSIGGLVLYLAWCIHWERSHPAASAARGIRRGEAAARLKVIREVERLGPQDPEGALPALIVALGDPESGNRAAAAEGLVAVIQAVRFSDSDPGPVRDAVAALMGRLADPQSTVRARASEALAMILVIWQDVPQVIDSDVLTAAIGEAAADPNPEVRLAAVRGLAVLGNPLSGDPPAWPLIAALEDESEAVRGLAAQAVAMNHGGLPRLLPELVKSLESTRPECRPTYLYLLRQIQPTGYPKDLADGMLQDLVSALGSRDREVRAGVLSQIGEFGPDARAVLPVLLAALVESGEGGPADSKGSHPTNDPAIAAARSLARVAGRGMQRRPSGQVEVFPVREVAPALMKLLESPAAGRRLAAVEALRSFDADDAMVAAFIAKVRDRDESVRAAALGALQAGASRSGPRVLGVVRDAMEDESPRVRAVAAWVLTDLGTGVESMVPALIRRAEHDPDRAVRDACASALRSLGPPAVTAAVVPSYIEALDRPEAPALLRGNLIDALARFGPAARSAVPAIVRVLRSTEVKGAERSVLPPVFPGEMRLRSADGPDVYRDALERVNLRRNAAHALGKLAADTPSAGDAASALVAALDDPDDEVNLQAIEALVAFGPAARSAAPALTRGLSRAGERKELWRAGRMAEALGRVDPAGPGGVAAVAFLGEVLDSQDPPPRRFAERVLGSIGPPAAAAVPRLVALSRDPVVRGNEELASVASAIGRIAPGTPGEAPALAALLELLQLDSRSPRLEPVIDAVARFGPGASAALPRLLELAKSGDPRVVEAARAAVAALEGPGSAGDGRRVVPPGRPPSGPSSPG